MGLLKQIQAEQVGWVLKNFPGRMAHMPLLGVVEELGEYEDATNTPDVLDALGDTVIFMSDLCQAHEFDLEAIAKDASYIEVPAKSLLYIVGRIAKARLKLEQGIRGSKAEHLTSMRQNLVLLYRQLQKMAAWNHQDLEQIAWETWQKVRLRDWTKNPLNGGETPT
jgi:hypothetical protein